MASSILNNYLEDPPEPGSNHPIEHVRASFTLSSSVASVAHSFLASYSSTPEVVAGVPDMGNADAQLDVWTSSRSASGMTVEVKSHGAVGASNAASIVIDFEAKPDLS